MKSLIVAAFALVLTSPAFCRAQAQESDPQAFTPAEQSLCQPDVFRLCNDYVPDDQQIAACMKAKRKQLSPECRKVFEKHMKRGR